jgi:uncharacterized surface protein with fasciclin (FAS1) repeats
MKSIFFSFRRLTVLAMGAILVLTTSCEKDEAPAPTPTPTLKNITEIVVSDTSFSLLKQAVVRAGLADALSAGSLTVFAPNNAAFRNTGIDSATISTIDTADLVDILTYHVIGSKIMSTDLQSSQAVSSLQGQNLYVSKNNNGVFVNGIRVNSPDIAASNGVIHVISSVIGEIPEESIAQIVTDNSDFSTLLAAVAKAGLASVFSGSGNYTVFAPTNDAFAAAGLTPEVINDPSLPVAAVVAILKAHVIGTNVFASDLIQGATAPTLQTGVTLTIGTTPPSIKIVGGVNTVASNITEANIIATNGVIHVIDKVLR